MDTKDTPKTLLQAIRYFSDPDICLKFVAELRWKDGVTCPHCQSKEVGFLATRRIWKCKNKDCRKQFSVKVGTIFEDSPIGLDKWLVGIWLIANAKNGISSYEIHRSLGITQKSAWFLLHRIRLAMQTGTFEKLNGPVEVDETYVGGLYENMHKSKRPARNETNKVVVMGLLERGNEEQHSTVRTQIIPDTSRYTLHNNVANNITKGAQVYTDTHPGYAHLYKEFKHATVDHSIEYVNGDAHTNGLENFWTLVKRCVKGTYVQVSEQHAFRYLEEESYRFNTRGGNDGDRFTKMIERVAGKRLTYKKLTGKQE